MPGDLFVPLGMKGRQKLKKYLINRKVPRQLRSRCPVLLSQDQIIWIGGHQIDDSVKVTSKTRRILKIELLLA
jgi:tRNA(Ile)-lysidine synthase